MEAHLTDGFKDHNVEDSGITVSYVEDRGITVSYVEDRGITVIYVGDRGITLIFLGNTLRHMQNHTCKNYTQNVWKIVSLKFW